MQNGRRDMDGSGRVSLATGEQTKDQEQKVTLRAARTFASAGMARVKPKLTDP